MNKIVRDVTLSGLFFLLMGAANAEEADRLEQVTITDSEDDSSLEAAPPLGYSMGGRSAASIPGGGGDPLRALQTLPGVVTNNDASAAPAVRGSRPEDNLYFVDFMPTGYIFHMGGAISVFNSQLVESFDLYPAAFGAEYAGSTGAVIDVKLRDPHEDELSTTLDISMLQAGMLVEGPVTENQSFYFAARMSYLDLLVGDQIDIQGVDMVQFPKYTDYQGKYLWKLENGSRVTFQATGATDNVEVNLDATADGVENDPVLIGNHSNDTSYNSQGVVWEEEHGGNGLTLGVSHIGNETVTHAAAAADARVTMDNWYGRARWTKPLGSDHLLAVGGEVANINADYDVSYRDPGCTEFDVDCQYTDATLLGSKAKVTVNWSMLYVEENWYPNDQWALTAGLSGNQEDYLNESYLEPRLRAEYTPHPGWTYSVGAGRYHQFPQFIQVEKVFGNPELTQFNADHYVVGLEHQLGNGWEWKAEAYYKKLNNLVTSDPITRYSNEGEGESKGVELLLRKAATDKLSGWLSVSLSKAERINTATGERFPFEYDQPVVVSLVGDYRFNDRWSLGAKWWYHSGAPYTPITGGTAAPLNPGRYIPTYGEINSKRMPDYHRLDLRVNRHYSKNTTAYMELVNAYAQKNVGGYDYNVDYTSRKEIYQLPFLISFGFTTKF